MYRQMGKQNAWTATVVIGLAFATMGAANAAQDDKSSSQISVVGPVITGFAAFAGVLVAQWIHGTTNDRALRPGAEEGKRGT